MKPVRPQTFAVTAGTLLVMALLLVMAGRPKAPDEKPVTPPVVRLLTVTGEGEVRAKPDIAYLPFQLRIQGASAAEAEALHAASVAHLLTVMTHELGVKPEDIRAPAPTLRTVTGQTWNAEMRVVGHEAVSDLLVVIRELDQVAPISARLILEGVTEMDQVIYGLADPEQLRQSATQQAMQSAQARAAMLAQAAQAKITGVSAATVLADEGPPVGLGLVTAPLSASADEVVVRIRVEATFTAE